MDESAYTRIADPRISLTQRGIREAEECGRDMRSMIEGDGVEDWSVYFYVSPYKRTRQTLQHLATSFDPPRISGLREEPRLREQDFGTFPFSVLSFFNFNFITNLKPQVRVYTPKSKETFKTESE